MKYLQKRGYLLVFSKTNGAFGLDSRTGRGGVTGTILLFYVFISFVIFYLFSTVIFVRAVTARK